MKHLLTIFLIVIAFAAGCIFDGLVTRVSPDALTSGQLLRLKKDIEGYYANKKVLPATLKDVIHFASSSVSTNNVWGGPILYSTMNKTSVLLKTYGPGGSDARVKQEFTLQFDVKPHGMDQ